MSNSNFNKDKAGVKSIIVPLLNRPHVDQGKQNKTNDLLINLLAVIHRDGGHYTAKHGINKSVADAMTIVSNAIVK